MWLSQMSNMPTSQLNAPDKLGIILQIKVEERGGSKERWPSSSSEDELCQLSTPRIITASLSLILFV